MKKIWIILYYFIIFVLFQIHSPELRVDTIKFMSNFRENLEIFMKNNTVINTITQVNYAMYFEILKNKSEVAYNSSKYYGKEFLYSTNQTFNAMWKKLIKTELISSGEGIKQKDHPKLSIEKLNSECKHNFASQSSGASLIEYPRDSDGASGILSSSKDKYLIISSLSSNKNFLISLSEDAIIDQFMLMNSEEFSCTVKDFDLYGSDTFVSRDQKWTKLGNFTAHKSQN